MADINITLVGVGASAQAGGLTDGIGAALPGSHATATPGALTTASFLISGASATAHAGAFVLGVSARARSALMTAVGAAVTVAATPIAYFSLARIMRDKPVPAVGAMGNAFVAAIGTLFPSGPAKPVTHNVSLDGASITATAASLTTNNALFVDLVGAGMIAQANFVTTTP